MSAAEGYDELINDMRSMQVSDLMVDAIMLNDLIEIMGDKPMTMGWVVEHLRRMSVDAVADSPLHTDDDNRFFTSSSSQAGAVNDDDKWRDSTGIDDDDDDDDDDSINNISNSFNSNLEYGDNVLDDNSLSDGEGVDSTQFDDLRIAGRSAGGNDSTVTSSSLGGALDSSASSSMQGSFYFKTPQKGNGDDDRSDDVGFDMDINSPLDTSGSKKKKMSPLQDTANEAAPTGGPAATLDSEEGAHAVSGLSQAFFSMGLKVDAENDSNRPNVGAKGRSPGTVRVGAKPRRGSTPFKRDVGAAAPAALAAQDASSGVGIFWGSNPNPNPGFASADQSSSSGSFPLPPGATSFAFPPPPPAPTTAGMFNGFVHESMGSVFEASPAQSDRSATMDIDPLSPSADPRVVFTLGVDDRAGDSGRKAKAKGRVAKKTSAAPAAAAAGAEEGATKKKEPASETAERLRLAELYRNEGKRLYQEDKYEMALDAYSKALDFASFISTWRSRQTVLGNRAATYMMLNRPVEAISDCDAALAEDPQLVKLQTRKGRALLRLGDLHGADEAFQRVMQHSSLPGHAISRDAAEELESSKAEAKEELRRVARVRAQLQKAEQLYQQHSYRQCADLVDSEILKECPFMRSAHCIKISSLNRLHRFSEGKTAAEELGRSTHASVLALCFGGAAGAVFPRSESLLWRETSPGAPVRVDPAAVVQAMLTLGPSMAREYVVCLKNNDACRNCCADVMDRVAALLAELYRQVSASPDRLDANGLAEFAEPPAAWQWVRAELLAVRDIIDQKNKADKAFRAGQFNDAVRHYSQAVTLSDGRDDTRWEAILLSNRAAAYMKLRHFAEAVADCHQAVARDAGYMRAYLRRARANASLLQYPASIRWDDSFIRSFYSPSIRTFHAKRANASAARLLQRLPQVRDGNACAARPQRGGVRAAGGDGVAAP